MALTSLIKCLRRWVKSKAFFFFSIFHPQFAVNKQKKQIPCSAFHWMFIFKTGHSAAYDLCTYYMENTQKVREQLHSGIYLRPKRIILACKWQKCRNGRIQDYFVSTVCIHICIAERDTVFTLLKRETHITQIFLNS